MNVIAMVERSMGGGRKQLRNEVRQTALCARHGEQLIGTSTDIYRNQHNNSATAGKNRSSSCTSVKVCFKLQAPQVRTVAKIHPREKRPLARIVG
jgi:hypothetical protein